MVRHDPGGEYTGRFSRFCTELGIRQQITCVHTPQQNGEAERFNGTLVNQVRALCHGQGVPDFLWPEMMQATVRVYNMLHGPDTAQSEDKSCWELWYQVKPSLTPFRVYGCVANVMRKYKRSHTKLESKSNKGLLVGSGDDTKGWRIWVPARSHTVFVTSSADVKFDESITGAKHVTTVERLKEIRGRLQKKADDVSKLNKKTQASAAKRAQKSKPPKEPVRIALDVAPRDRGHKRKHDGGGDDDQRESDEEQVQVQEVNNNSDDGGDDDGDDDSGKSDHATDSDDDSDNDDNEDDIEKKVERVENGVDNLAEAMEVATVGKIDKSTLASAIKNVLINAGNTKHDMSNNNQVSDTVPIDERDAVQPQEPPRAGLRPRDARKQPDHIVYVAHNNTKSPKSLSHAVFSAVIQSPQVLGISRKHANCAQNAVPSTPTP